MRVNRRATSDVTLLVGGVVVLVLAAAAAGEDVNPVRPAAASLLRDPKACVAFAEEAMRRARVEPKHAIVRGGTDGSRLTEMGLPTPNLSTGEHNIHSPLEWTCLEEMEAAVRVLVELAQVWARAT